MDPTPAFDPEATRYVATVSGERANVRANSPRSQAVIDQITVDGETTVLASPDNLLNTSVDTPEGAITRFSLRVVAEDGTTTKNYYIDFPRPAADTVPDITIEADPSEYVAGLGALDFTLTREGDTTDSLDVTVSISQDRPWLPSTAYTATFAAGDAEASLLVGGDEFSSDVTQSGDLVAIVAAVDGYDTSGARTLVEVISQEGPAVTVAFEHASYTFAENVGEVNLKLVARPEADLPFVPTFSVSVSTEPGTAGSPGDYGALSGMARITNADFVMESGQQVARVNVPRTDPGVVLRPGESITARIDSDVALRDMGLNESYWGARGIESLDDRDVFRIEITDAGTYGLTLSGQPTGVGVRYVWDHRGNLFAGPLDAGYRPAASAQYEYAPGTYYVELGTSYESEGNTGEYTLPLEPVLS